MSVHIVFYTHCFFCEFFLFFSEASINESHSACRPIPGVHWLRLMSDDAFFFHVFFFSRMWPYTRRPLATSNVRTHRVYTHCCTLFYFIFYFVHPLMYIILFYILFFVFYFSFTFRGLNQWLASDMSHYMCFDVRLYIQLS